MTPSGPDAHSIEDKFYYVKPHAQIEISKKEPSDGNNLEPRRLRDGYWTKIKHWVTQAYFPKEDTNAAQIHSSKFVVKAYVLPGGIMSFELSNRTQGNSRDEFNVVHWKYCRANPNKA